jgi:hypothetical protein
MPCKSSAHEQQLANARLKSWSDGSRISRSEKMRAHMSDPLNRKKQFAAMRTPEAEEKRRAALRRPVEDRFFNYASPEPNTGCWLWSGSCDSRGYGQIRVDGKLRFASHIALELDGRPRPFPSACARHKCDHPPCVNPDHLIWGSRKENTRDAIERGRLNVSGLELGRGASSNRKGL